MADTTTEEVKLTEKQRLFCHRYIRHWNGAKAAREVGYSETTAKEIACENLTKPHIAAYINEIKADIEKEAGLSKLMVVEEHQKLAFSSIAHLHDTWITRKAFEELTDDQKSCISEISTQIKTTRNEDGSLSENEYIKVKLYDKQKSLESIAKLLGYNDPEKSQVLSFNVELTKEEARRIAKDLEDEC